MTVYVTARTPGDGWFWRCDCGALETGYVSERYAEAAAERHKVERHSDGEL